ncbi:hypothetical protein [Cellvibrio sp. PSBB023]|jgi:outer membrane protein assembly factor BamA|uniref:hypothetical protein n=1 Tax=Cellvibrio sp. PSBB023 TaxID=1945512 RepID=UPI001FEEE424|nr:hypothetical protein [Cellvibrio sp. PSBB023]
MMKAPGKGLLKKTGCWFWGALASVSVCAVAETESDNTVMEEDASCVPYQANKSKTLAITDAHARVETNVFEGMQGKRIRHIQYNTLSIFDKDDPRENNSLYLFLNKLHINTRPHVIRAQLLFSEGEAFDLPRVQESERILRKRPYLTNAYILPLNVCDDQLDVLVVTQDAWALEPQFSVSKESEGTKSGFAISDGNILGSGNSLTVGYEENAQRNLVNYDFRNPHIFNSQIAVKLYYADTSDGRDTIVDVSHPFYSLQSPWAAGFYTQDVTQEQKIRHMDENINEFQHQAMNNRVYFGLATDITETHTQRWLVGVSNEEDNFYSTSDTTQPLPLQRKAVYPWVEYQYLENRFGVFKNVNQIQRPEDIALGQNLAFRLGYGGTAFDNTDDVVRYIGNYTNIIEVDKHHILEAGVTIDGRHYLNLDSISTAIIGFNVNYNYFQDEKRRWYLGLRYDIGQDLAQHEELTVGDITGLRGYPTDFQRGNERYVFTIERRYFSDLHIFNLMRVGTVVFFDMGKAWGIDEYGYSPLLSNVGVGLRFSSSKVRIGNVVHVDLATPTSARAGLDKYQLTIGAQQRF